MAKRTKTLKANRQADTAVFRFARHALQLAGEGAPFTVRRERWLGRDWIVVPVVALTETVLECVGCDGPELAPADEFAKNPASWDDLPITYSHPRDAAGSYVSARSASARRFVIGRIRNAKRVGDALHVEAWLDPELVKSAAGGKAEELLDRLGRGERIEVSTGFFADTTDADGELDGRRYGSVQSNHIGDHLAILEPSDIGACSWEQGCGVRDAKGDFDMISHAACCKDGKPCARGISEALVLNQVSDTDRREALSRALTKTHADAEFIWVVAVFEDEVVFQMNGQILRQSYRTTDEDTGAVEIEGEAEEVRPVTKFVTASANEDPKFNQDRRSDMTKEQKDLIEKLVVARKLEGEKADALRTAMKDVAIESLKVLVASEPEPPKDDEKPDKPAEPPKAAADKKPEQDAKPAEQPSFEKWLESAPKDFRESLDYALKAAEREKVRVAAERAQAIEAIKANERNKLTDELLEAMPAEALMALAETLSPPKANESPNTAASYIGLGGPRGHAEQGGHDPCEGKTSINHYAERLKMLQGGKAA